MKQFYLLATCIAAVLFSTSLNAISLVEKFAPNIQKVYNPNIHIVDINNDGLPDIFQTGTDGSNYYTLAYLNNNNFDFTALALSLPNLQQAQSDWYDYNNDGYEDVVISGIKTNGEKQCSIFKNNGDSTFTQEETNIEQVAYGSVCWADFDNDGKTDLLINGINNAGNKVSTIYRNTGAGFVAEHATIAGVSNGKTIVSDFNNDGKKDIFATGINTTGQKESYIYFNKGNFVFEASNNHFESITNGDAANGDIDGNGFDDILLTGSNASGKRISKLYLNNHGVFIESATANLDSLSGSFANLTDINNDGKLDIFLTGQDNKLFYNTLLFLNNGDNTYTKDVSFPFALIYGNAAFADFDNDTRKDLFICGKTYAENIGKIFQNSYSATNSAPSIPSNLSSTTIYDSVSFKWPQSTDNECDTKDITYNIYIGMESGRNEVFAPNSFTNNGIRKLQASGNCSRQLSLALSKLNEGVYYWSVQAIDNNYNASAFAPEKTFTICHKLNIGKDTSACMGDTITFQTGTLEDSVNWYSVKKGLLIANSNYLKYRVIEKDQIIAELRNIYNCIVRDTLEVNAKNLPTPYIGKDSSICFNSMIKLDLKNNYKSIKWNSTQKGQFLSDTSIYCHVALNTDTIWTNVTDQFGCKNSDTIIILKNDLPIINLGSDLSICYKDTVKLPTLTKYKSANWKAINSEASLSNKMTFKYQVLKTDTLIAIVADENQCLNSDTIVVKKLELPKISIGKDTSVCYMNNLTIKAKASIGNINWYSRNLNSIASNTGDIEITTLKNDSIWAIITDSLGCRNSDTLFLKKFDLPTFNIGHDTAVCYNSEIRLNAGTGWKKVDWYSKKNGKLLPDSWFYSQITKQTDTLFAEVTDYNNCVNRDSISIISWPLPVFDIGRDTSACLLDSTTLSLENKWYKTEWFSFQTGKISNSNSIIHIFEKKDSIWAKVTDHNSCLNLDTIILTPLLLPKLHLPIDTALCYNDTLKLNISNNLKLVQWTSTNGLFTKIEGNNFGKQFTNHDKVVVLVSDSNGCKNYDTTTVFVHPLPSINLGNDTAICINNSIQLAVFDTLQNAHWQTIKGEIIEDKAKKINTTPLQSETIIVQAISNFRCLNSDSIYIKVNKLPVVNAGLDTFVCYGSNITIGETPTAQDDADSFKYKWSNIKQADFEKANPTIEATHDSTFWVDVTDSNGCKASDTVKIGVNPPSHFELPDTLAICIGKKATIEKSKIISGSRHPYTFEWWPDSTLDNPTLELPVFNPLTSTKYRVIASSWKCEPDTAFLDVIVRPLPKIFITPTLTIGEKGFAELYAEGGTYYRWSPSNSLNQNNIPNPIAKPDLTTTYTVQVTDSFGCIDEDSVKVHVANSIFIPNLFTPNNDGNNENFKIYGFGIRELNLKITDKQNRIVYESQVWDYISGVGWNGNFKGNPQAEGTYRWHISGKFINGETILFKGKQTGILTLVR